MPCRDLLNFEPKMIRNPKSEYGEEEDDGRDCKDVQEIPNNHLHQLLLPGDFPWLKLLKALKNCENILFINILLSSPSPKPKSIEENT